MRLWGIRHIALAAGVEFIHTATLLHDDVVDASDLRRGRDTANAVWGNKPAVLVGDFLFARSFEGLMVEDGSLRILEILRTPRRSSPRARSPSWSPPTTRRRPKPPYLDVIEAPGDRRLLRGGQPQNSAAGHCRTLPPAEEEALERFGRNLGMAYQY